MIGRNHEPRGVLGRGLVQHVLESCDILVPVLALLIVGVADLPVLGGVFQSLLESGELLVLRDIEEEFEDRGFVLDCKQLFEGVDHVVARRPDFLGRQLMHAHREDVLVVRSVEDRHLTFARRVRVHPPQKVVQQFLRGRPLEPGDLAAGRVHSRHQVAHHAVLAAGIEALQHDQQRMALLRVHQVLELVHLRDVLRDLRPRLLMALVPARIGRVDVVEFDPRARLHHQRLAIVQRSGLSLRAGRGSRSSATGFPPQRCVFAA